MMPPSQANLLTLDTLAHWRESLPSAERLVVTNGCFDILHTGHLRYLAQARALGTHLLVGLNGDDSVRQLKGPTRPIHPEAERTEMLAALRIVDSVCIFPEKRATRFLSLARPHIYAKGGDYTPDQLDQDEVDAVRQAGGEIHILPLVPGRSTTQILSQLSDS